MEQTLYFGGPILTMEQPLYAEALLEEDGVIRCVGRLEEARAQASPYAREVNLEGRALLPAFLDAHSHFIACANAMLQVPLGECADQAELCQRLASFVERQGVPAGEWVRGTAYDHNTLAEGRAPDRWQLDRACPYNPVIIQHASGHVGVFNSRALELLGVDETTPCPEGGVMERDQGQLTGYMEENAFLSLQKRVPMVDPSKLLMAAEKVQDQYASYGITTIQEGMFIDLMTPLYQEMVEGERLKLDVVAYTDPRNCQKAMERFADHVGCYQHHFKIGGDKIFLDGSPQGRTAWMRAPYQGSEDGYCGYPVLRDEEVYSRLRDAQERNVQILAHCNGDQAAEQYLTAMERLEADTGRHLPRPVMVHAQLLGLDQMARVKALGVIPSFFVAHVYHWGEVHVKNFGLERADRISPAGAALKADIPFTFHQDAPVIQPNMLETVWCAVSRQTKTGRVLGQEQRIPVLDALKAITCNAAYQYFEEDQKGSLRAGKRADLVILSQDPLAVDPAQLKSIQVLETRKDGQTIWTA